MRLGDAELRMDAVHASLGDPQVFPRDHRDTTAAAPVFTSALPSLVDEIPLEQYARETRDSLLRIEAYLLRPRWYQRLWQWIRDFNGYRS